MPYERNADGQMLHPEYGYVICGFEPTKHPNKYGDRICTQAPVHGRTRCKMHGGKTKFGVDHPNYKHGKFTKTGLQNWQRKYEAARLDPELTDVQRIIASRHVFIIERLGALEDAPDAADIWQQMSKSVNALDKAYRDSDTYGMAYGLDALRAVISERHRYYANRNEVENALTEQRRDIEALNKIELAGEKAISALELLVFMDRFFGAVERIVTNASEAQELRLTVRGILEGSYQLVE